MWWLGAVTLIFGLVGAGLELFQGNSDGDINPVCPWDIDDSPVIDNPFSFLDFKNWKKEILGLATLALVLKYKPWK